MWGWGKEARDNEFSLGYGNTCMPTGIQIKMVSGAWKLRGTVELVTRIRNFTGHRDSSPSPRRNEFLQRVGREDSKRQI